MSILKRPGLLILTVGLGTLLNPLNSSMIAVAIARIQENFELTFAHTSWLIAIFYLFSSIGQPVMGKLSDLFGAKRLFLVGLTLVTVSCIIAPFSPNLLLLLCCRALQAIGSSALFPSGMSIIRRRITTKQGKALATLSIFSATSAAVGPSVGGLLIANWDWPAIFLVNLPITLISFGMALFVLPNERKQKVEIKQIDFIGIFFFSVSMVGFILFLLSLDQRVLWWAFGLFIVTAVIFYFYEEKQKEPFINLRYLKKNTSLTFIYVQFICINIIHYFYFFGIPTFLQKVHKYDEQNTGLIMLSFAGFSVCIVPLTGRLVDRWGARVPLIIGACLLAIGTTLLLFIHESSPLLSIITVLGVIGMGSGFNNVSIQAALFENVQRQDTGSATGLLQTSRFTGAILSSGLLGLVFNRHIDIQQLHFMAFICIVFCAVVLTLSFQYFIRRRTKRHKCKPLKSSELN